MTDHEKIDKLQAIYMNAEVYLSEADVSVELQGDDHIVTVDDVEGTGSFTIDASVLQQLTDIELRWLSKTCREIRAGRE
jgi:hypothetical protein